MTFQYALLSSFWWYKYSFPCASVGAADLQSLFKYYEFILELSLIHIREC